MTSIRENIQTVRKRIAEAAARSGRSEGDVTLIGVSKTVTAEKVIEAANAGITVFGENRVQEARDKIALAGGDLEWHMIGRLQKNKAKYVPGLFSMVHSVDSCDLASSLNLAMEKAILINPEMKRSLDILVQVNVSGEASKGGTSEAGIVQLIQEVSRLPYLRIRGLMTIPPAADSGEFSRRYFRELRELRDRIAMLNIVNVEMKELSMGMSGDYEVAIEEGATMVRVGSSIFGHRDYQR